MKAISPLPEYFRFELQSALQELGQKKLLHVLQEMLRVRQFETRAEAAYQAGNIGGFFHSYIGQEAIQTAVIAALGLDHWYITSYRCHALALLLGEPPNELMAELFGKATGNAKGRGGSMHLYSKRLLGGFGIVGGQIPIATGAAFSAKYQGHKDEVAVCFFGDGAVPQGTFHESLNFASIHSLPCIYVIENNQWSMGTPLKRTLANYANFSKAAANAYGLEHYLLDGMNFFSTYTGFKHAYEHVKKTQRPVLIECHAERFKGHSISDPGLYRSKEEVKQCIARDPIVALKTVLLEAGWLKEDEFKQIETNCRQEMVNAISFAETSPWPEVSDLEQGVFAS